MGLYDAACDCESQPGTVSMARLGPLADLLELVEYSLLVVF